ncbi:MAG: hypothetical protein JXR32_00845 [Anaerolineaceae bacterium]|nr:hypothetical protein [Anaerolineaceae bacterium]
MELRRSLIKPTVDTPFHIDFDWWKQNDNDWKVYLMSCLCLSHQEVFTELNSDDMVDAIDPVTAEIHQVNAVQHALMNHCAKQDDFINEHTSLVDGVFRLFISNGNTPMTAIELSNIIHRPAEMIVRTLAGMKVYKGIRPCK